MTNWSARLAERRAEQLPGCPAEELPKLTDYPFVGFVGGQEYVSQGIEALRGHLGRLANAEGIDRQLIAGLQLFDVAACAGLPVEILRTYIRALRDSDLRRQGKVPPDETAAAMCRLCGPVWLHPAVASVAPIVDGWPRVLGCPWCHLRERTLVPRPPIAHENRASPDRRCGRT